MEYNKRKANVLFNMVDVIDEFYADAAFEGKRVKRESAWQYYLGERQRVMRLTGPSTESGRRASNAMWDFMMGPNP